MIRTFHPVGQGAFYSEQHKTKDKEFTVVYDCGSGNVMPQAMVKKVISTFQKNHVIDALFISHFHADHINGIEHLKKYYDIKRVFIPLVDKDDIILYTIRDVMHNNRLVKGKLEDYKRYKANGLIADLPNLSNYFNENTSVISVLPLPLETEEKVSEANVQDIDNLNREISSGTRISIDKSIDTDWFLIPFNYRYSELKDEFEKKLKEQKLSLEQLNGTNDILRNKDKIKKAYKKVTGGLNPNSMILFSGVKDSANRLLRKMMYSNSECLCRIYNLLFSYNETPCGCLYLGDVDLNQTNIVADIRKRMGDVWNNIGTIQIPHHGSVHNFNSDILGSMMRNAVISYGGKNQYGHPSDSVKKELFENAVIPYDVTEIQSTVFIQQI